jgi:hypothetical protein
MELNYLEIFHWSFFAVAFAVAVLTDLKKRIFKLFPTKKWHKVILDGRSTPAILGFGIGLIPGITTPSIVSYGIESALYFMTAGIFSVWIYGLAERVIKEFVPEKLKRWFASDKKEEAQDE